MRNSLHSLFSAICSLFFVAVVSTSCATDDFDVAPPAVENIDPYAISVDEALAEMYSLMDVLYGPGTRAAGRKIASVETLKSHRLAPMTRCTMVVGPELSNDLSDLVYVVNFEDNEGFAILGADQRVESVICITEGGNFTLEEMLQIAREMTGGGSSGELLPVWMSYEDIHYSFPDRVDEPFDITDYNTDYEEGEEPSEPDTGEWVFPMMEMEYDEVNAVSMANNERFAKSLVVEQVMSELAEATVAQQTRGNVDGYIPPPRWDGCGSDELPDYGTDEVLLKFIYGPWTEVEKIGPFVETKWDQDAPFNNNCPENNTAGCVAIAIAQIVACNEKPAPSWFCPEITSTWEELKSHDYYDNGLKDTISLRIRNDIAKIVHRIGEDVHMVYGISGDASSATPAAAKRYLGEFYTDVKKYEHYSRSALEEMIRVRRKPAFMLAFAGISAAHAWAADGFLTQEQIITVTWGGEVIDRIRETRTLVHYNLGWRGQCDGYYLMEDRFDLRSGPEAIDKSAGDLPNTRGHDVYHWYWRVIKYKTE